MWGDPACCCWLCRGREATPANGCGQTPEAAKGKKSNPCGILLRSSGYDLALFTAVGPSLQNSGRIHFYCFKSQGKRHLVKAALGN